MFPEASWINDIVYREPQLNKNGSRTVSVSLEGSRLCFQTAPNQEQDLQVATWGLSPPMPGAAPEAKRNLQLTIESEELESFLRGLDEKNQQVAADNSAEWFKKSLDRDAIAQMYVPLVKPGKDGGKPMVTMKVKVSDPATKVYVVHSGGGDSNLKYSEGVPDDITRGSKILAMVDTTGLWFMPRQFGMAFTVKEMFVWKHQSSKRGPEAFSLSANTKVMRVEAQPSHVEDEEEEGGCD